MSKKRQLIKIIKLNVKVLNCINGQLEFHLKVRFSRIQFFAWNNIKGTTSVLACVWWNPCFSLTGRGSICDCPHPCVSPSRTHSKTALPSSWCGSVWPSSWCGSVWPAPVCSKHVRLTASPGSLLHVRVSEHACAFPPLCSRGRLGFQGPEWL